ncbi:MAG: hypothetical protein JO266_14435 [Acidobacteria bacterium]|nr:hypothetical protein [Acidobacteriota bacterium]
MDRTRVSDSAWIGTSPPETASRRFTTFSRGAARSRYELAILIIVVGTVRLIQDMAYETLISRIG